MGELAECLLLALAETYAPAVQLPLNIRIEPHGKPYLADGAFHFSISHTDSFAVAAVSDKPIGVDIERRDRAVPRLLDRIRHPLETDADLDATALFSAKESITKRTGQGMYTPFCTVRVVEHPVVQTLICDHILSVCCDSAVKVYLWDGTEFSPYCELAAVADRSIQCDDIET